jgi:hypothetical protein
MFSLLLQFVRWTLILMIAAAITLAAFFLSVSYEGDGRFQVSWKETPGLAGTVSLATGPGTAGPAPGSPAAPALTGCARIRAQLDAAVAQYQERTRLPMSTLDIFALLDAEVLTELPACPRGGSFQRADDKVTCSLHR